MDRQKSQSQPTVSALLTNAQFGCCIKLAVLNHSMSNDIYASSITLVEKIIKDRKQ